MNYPYIPNNQYYIQDLEQMRNKIDSQINQLRQQNMQPTPITQNFQLAPNNSNLKFVNSIEDVQRDIVIADTYFITNDLSSMWLKSTNGNIRSFAIQEIKPKDEKDLMIENLQNQINELKGAKNNEYIKSNDEQSNTTTRSSITTTEPSNVSTTKSSKTK